MEIMYKSPAIQKTLKKSFFHLFVFAVLTTSEFWNMQHIVLIFLFEI